MTETLHKGDWLIAPVPLPKARRFVARHHYAGGASNTATHLSGLFRRSDYELCGVAWWIPPTRGAAVALLRGLREERLCAFARLNPPALWLALLAAALRSEFSDPNAVLSLSRLALSPDAPKNAATFLLMNSVKELGERWRVLVTYADTWRGHTGHIYRAAGWTHLGLSKPEKTYVRGGVMASRKCGPKTHTHAEMLSSGAECVGSFAKHRFRLVRKVRANKLPESAQASLFDKVA